MNEQLFTNKSQYYENSRPFVAREAVDYLCSLISPDAVFADIGAGTGKFTSLIAERGNIIYAVEPNAEMNSVLTNKLGEYANVKILSASAENTKIPSNSVDVVVSVTSLHWFELDKFRVECLRILKPRGFVVAIYNSQRKELENKTNNHPEKTATEIFFNDNCKIVEFPNPQIYSREKFIAYHLSHASSPTPSDNDYCAYLDRINIMFEQNNVDDNYLLDFVSVLYIDTDFIHNNS